MGRALKLFVVLAAVSILLVVLAGVLPVLLWRGYSPGGWSGYTPPTMVEEQHPVLETLNYTFVGAREHAGLVWSRLSEHSQDDPSIVPYLEWLRWVFSARFEVQPFRHGDYIVLSVPLAERKYVPYVGSVWFEPVKYAELPAEHSKIKMGYIRLPYGYAIIMTAYQDSDGQVNIVIHGTIVNETEFFELAVKTLAYRQYYSESFIYNLTLSCMEPTTVEVCEIDKTLIGKRATFRVVPLWFLWRVALPGYGYLEVNETTRIPIRDVYLLIEMPMLGAFKTSHLDEYDVPPASFLSYNEFIPSKLTDGVFIIYMSRSLEYVYMALSHPVFGLASSFTEIDPMTARELALRGVTISLPYFGYRSLLTIRIARSAVCQGASTSTAMAASLLGYPAIVTRNPEHSISGVARLSSLGETGQVELEDDVDLDGVPDSYDVLVDTARLDMDKIKQNFRTAVMVCPPLFCTGYRYPSEEIRLSYSIEEHAVLSMALTGVPQIVLGLPDWLKTPALIRHQEVTERWVESALKNYALYAVLENKLRAPLYGYAYDEESDTLVPASGLLEVHLAATEPAVRLVMSLKGLGPELFKPPSANSTRDVLSEIQLLYWDTKAPDTRKYVLEYHRNRGTNVFYPTPEQTPVVQPVPTPTPEPPKPVEAEVVLEPVYVEVIVYRNETFSLTAKAFDRWEGKVVVKGNEYTVRLYLSQRYDRPGEYVYVLEVVRQVDWWSTMTWHAYYQELPGNETRAELDLDVGRVALTFYYKPAELPGIGLIEVSEDALTLYQEYEIMLDGELITARLYVINATTINEHPLLIVQRGSAVVAVSGAVGTLGAGVSVQVYGAPTRIRYTVTAELVLPNGTTIPLKLDWWSPNPPETGIIYVSTTTYNLPPMKLSGSTLRIVIQELNLTVAIRIPG